MLLTTYLEGEAAQVAKVAVALGREVQDTGLPVAPPACLILGGETTVTLGDHPGQGGRNQELALAAAIALDGDADITIVSLATDGTDGPTDSAGGIADGGTVRRGRAAGHDPEAHLRAPQRLSLSGGDARPAAHRADPDQRQRPGLCLCGDAFHLTNVTRR